MPLSTGKWKVEDSLNRVNWCLLIGSKILINKLLICKTVVAEISSGGTEVLVQKGHIPTMGPAWLAESWAFCRHLSRNCFCHMRLLFSVEVFSPLWSVDCISFLYSVGDSQCCMSPIQPELHHEMKDKETKQPEVSEGFKSVPSSPSHSHKPVLERTLMWHYFYLSFSFPLLFIYLFISWERFLCSTCEGHPSECSVPGTEVSCHLFHAGAIKQAGQNAGSCLRTHCLWLGSDGAGWCPTQFLDHEKFMGSCLPTMSPKCVLISQVSQKLGWFMRSTLIRHPGAPWYTPWL